MRLLTWNVNGLRAIMKKGFEQILDYIDADIVCLQEIKCLPEQVELDEDLYPFQYVNSAVRKGYSGTLIAARTEPESVQYGIGQEEHDQEGRVITLEYPDFFVVDVYVPNAGEGQKRLGYRQQWDQAFSGYLRSLNEKKPVMICGDFNIARTALDLYDEQAGANSSGYTPEERSDFEKLLMPYFKDAFRELYPDKRQYSWWSYQGRDRMYGRGWRIDYWLVSPILTDRVRSVEILDDVYGSDHAPVLMDIDESF